MSVFVMGLVWRRKIPTNPKMVLLKLADHANDEGLNVYPSIARIAEETSLCERTVQKHMADFRKSGLIVVEREGGQGRGDPTVYRMDLEALEGLFPPVRVKGAADSPLPPKKGESHDKPTGERVHPGAVKGESQNTKGCKAIAPDSSRTIKEPSRARASEPEGSRASAQEPASPVVQHVRDCAADIKHETGQMGGPNFLATATIPHSDQGGVFVFAVASAWAVDYGSRQFAVPLARALKRKQVVFQINDFAKVAINKARAEGRPAWKQAA